MIRRHIGLLFLLLGLMVGGPVSPSMADEVKPAALPWIMGPTDAKLGDQALLKLPKGYQFLGAQETQQLLKQMGNFPSGSELGLITATGEGEEWFMVVRYIDAGYVKDDEAANWDADALMAAIKEGTDEDNERRQAQGFPPLVIRGWEETPHYDKAANKVVWAISAQERDSVGVNYNTLALGRQGYLSMNMVGSLEHLAVLKPHVGLLLANVEFVEGKRYTDFNSTTDKVAAVGLSALIAGAAVKSGLLAKLWAFIIPLVMAGKKLLMLAVIALGGLAAKYLKKKPHAEQPGGGGGLSS
ncbi:MAG: DUF2167 domain-containing protein [Nitrospira sp.]|jgi:uncharacterized membrane-anchored protein|nr:DUF2167 domain-containing protein [Nitrospira sp.]MDR4475322.1 DUF2167 domain-containing protein [Nitrospira sp.]